MIALYLFTAGVFFNYSKSKYYPSYLYKVNSAYTIWISVVLFLIGTGLYVYQEGWVSGVLMAVSAISLMLCLVQLVTVLGKKYFYGLVIAIHGLLILSFLY